MGIQIYESHVTLPEHPAPCMRVLCHVHVWGLSCTSKQIFLSLTLSILVAKLKNLKKDSICRNRILYPLRLGPLFPNNAEILRPNAGLGPNQITN